MSIPAGANLKQVSQQLEDAGVILNKWTFILLARYQNQESAIKAGDYRFKENLTQVALLKALIKGDVIQNEIRFIEGWTFAPVSYTHLDVYKRQDYT